MRGKRRSLLEDMLQDAYPETFRRMRLRLEQSEYLDIHAERILDDIIATLEKSVRSLEHEL